MRIFLLSMLAFVGLSVSGLAPVAQAAGDHVPTPPSTKWSFNGVFGRYDAAQLRRGLTVYKGVCASCHGLRLVSYRNLLAIGLSKGEIKTFIGDAKVAGEPDESGDPTTRPVGLNDRFVEPYANPQAAAAANGGKVPPDLSLMAKARAHGPDYIKALMLGYKETPPATFVDEDGKPKKLTAGQYYNKYMSGHVIAMPPPLTGDDQVDYPKGAPKATVAQMAEDVSAFLMWAAEPKLDERKRMGIKVILFLLIMSLIFYAIFRQVSKEVKGH